MREDPINRLIEERRDLLHTLNALIGTLLRSRRFEKSCCRTLTRAGNCASDPPGRPNTASHDCQKCVFVLLHSMLWDGSVPELAPLSPLFSTREEYTRFLSFLEQAGAEVTLFPDGGPSACGIVRHTEELGFTLLDKNGSQAPLPRGGVCALQVSDPAVWGEWLARRTQG